MNFLNVFCVVLCLHTGLSTPPYHNNERYVIYGQSENNNVVETDTGPFNNQITYDTPSVNTWQTQKATNDSPDIQRQERMSKNPFLNTNDITIDRKLFSRIEQERPVQYPVGTTLSPTELNDLYQIRRNEANAQYASQTENLKEINSNYNRQENALRTTLSEVALLNSAQSVNGNLFGGDNTGNTILPKKYVKHLYTDENVINNYQNQPSIAPFHQERETRLDLQGISSDNIQSLTNTWSQDSSIARQLPSVININLDKDRSHFIDDIIKATKLYSLYSSANKLKRYMILRSDGTVEHTDDFDVVANKYPSSIVINSRDLEKYAKTNEDNLRTLISEKHIDKSFTNEPQSAITLNKQKLNEVVPEISQYRNFDVVNSNYENAQLSPLSDKIESIRFPTLLSEATQDTTKKIQPNITRENSINTDLSLIKSTNFTSSSDKKFNEENKNDNKNLSSCIPLNVVEGQADNNNNSSSEVELTNLENKNYSGIWIKDKDFWENLQSSAFNIVYFLFPPPSPQVKKETTITLYTNGTQIEEVVEIVDDEDGIPQALKTTKVIHAPRDTIT